MSDTRPHPFDMVFGGIADERFAAIRATIGDARDLDAFLMANPSVSLLHDLRPDGGIGEAIDDFVAFVHAAFCYWADGCRTVALDVVATHRICRAEVGAGRASRPTTRCTFRSPAVIWGQLDVDTGYEPLDGWFVRGAGGEIDIVACFGVHPNRPGLSVLAARGGRPGLPARRDRSPVFSPTMPGGDLAGLYTPEGEAEMLLLAWRASDELGGGR